MLNKIKDIIKSGQKVLVRCDRAGVFFGTLADYDNGTAEIRGCRRIWYWNGAASLSELAVTGPRRSGNKFSVTVESIVVAQVIEVIPCTDKAVKEIEAVEEWRA